MKSAKGCRNSSLWGLLAIVALAACQDSRDTSAAAETPAPGADSTATPPAANPTPPAVVAAPDYTKCQSQVVDAGQKGSVAGVARGLYSDTKMIPGTSSPATAFADQSALVLKLSYWNGSKFATEIVSGDGAASAVRLAFQSDGTPFVFWTLGTAVKVAIRSAPISSPGIWNAGAIDSGTAPRALEVSINPLGQIGVVFLTDTATTGRAKFLYCDSPCTSTSGFQPMAPNPYIENTAIVAAQTATGLGWCQASSNVYYPAVTYSVTGVVRYAVCQASLGNCANSSNWTTTGSVVATGNVSSKLLLDASIAGDVAKVATLGAGGVTIYRMGTTACNLAPAAFSAGSTLGTATSGSQWMTFLKDSLGKFHLIANEGTTSVRYYNSATTDALGSWNGAGVIDTNTLAAAHGGGAAIDTAGLGIYASYPIAAVPYHLNLARVSDYTVSSTSATFSRFVPDLSGDIQLTGAGTQQRNIVIASSSRGVPATVYLDYSVGAATGAKLKYAIRTGVSSNDPWESVLVPGTASPQYPALAFDDADRPWISYFDAGTNRFYLISNSRTDGQGTWSVAYEFPAIPGGAPVALPAANATAVAMSYTSGVASPVLIVIDTNAGTKGVKAAKLNPSTQNWSAVTTLDGLVAGALGAAHLVSDFDKSGTLVIAYQDLNLTRVKYATSANGITWSTPYTVSSVGQGSGVGIKLNPLTSKPSVTYYDQTNNAVYYASCSAVASACVSSGWSNALVDGAAGVSGLTAASGQLLSTSLNYSPSGTPWLLYPRGQGTGGHLMLGTPNSSGIWSSNVHAAGSNGGLAGSAALNFAVAGWNAAATVNSSGGLVSVYVGPGNWLYSTSCGDVP